MKWAVNSPNVIEGLTAHSERLPFCAVVTLFFPVNFFLSVQLSAHFFFTFLSKLIVYRYEGVFREY